MTPDPEPLCPICRQRMTEWRHEHVRVYAREAPDPYEPGVPRMTEWDRLRWRREHPWPEPYPDLGSAYEPGGMFHSERRVAVDGRPGPAIVLALVVGIVAVVVVAWFIVKP